MQEVRGILGDLPAVRMPRMPEGLAVVGLVTTFSRINYREFAKFERFAKAHGEDAAIPAHQARGLPNEDFSEAYKRFAKSLVPVGQGKGNDVRFGMEFETGRRWKIPMAARTA